MTDKEIAEIEALLALLARPSPGALLRARLARREVDGPSMPPNYLKNDLPQVTPDYFNKPPGYWDKLRQVEIPVRHAKAVGGAHAKQVWVRGHWRKL